MRKFLIILLLSAAQWAVAQNEGTLRLYLSPPAEAIAIDGEILEYGNTARLKPGKYFVQAWCPDKNLLDTIVTISSGEVLNFFYRFEDSPSYKSYQSTLNAYTKERNKNFVLPAATTVAMAGILTYTLIRGKQLQEQAESDYLSYKYAGYDIEKHEDVFEESQSKYRQYYYAQFVEYVALAVSSYFLYKGFKWLKNNPKPVKEEDKNPFKLEQVGFTPNPYGGIGIGMVLTLD